MRMFARTFQKRRRRSYKQPETKGKLLLSLDGTGEDGMGKTSLFPEDLWRTAPKKLARREAQAPQAVLTCFYVDVRLIIKRFRRIGCRKLYMMTGTRNLCLREASQVVCGAEGRWHLQCRHAIMRGQAAKWWTCASGALEMSRTR